MFSILSFYLLMFNLSNPAEIKPPNALSQNITLESQICRMFGSVYITSDPKQRNFARYIVYIEPEETYADLIVFKENNKLFADGPGLWFMTTSRNFADHIFYVTTNRAFADFSIHFTQKRTFAGCRN